MNKKLWKISMALLIAKMLMWIVWVGFIVYGNDWYLTTDQMGYWGWIGLVWSLVNTFWAIGVWAK